MTTPTPTPDLILARRLEAAEAFAAEEYARQFLRRRPGADVEIAEVAGGRAVFAGVGSPLTETKAVGLHGPVTDADLDRMEAVYFPRGAESTVVVCPLADPSLIDGLGRRGYELRRFENILAMPLASDGPEPVSPPDIEARLIDPAEVDRYAEVVTPNFVGPGDSLDDLRDLMRTMVAMTHARLYLAWIDGAPVGGGAVFIHDGLALLAGAATLPPFRNRGVHAALHHARLADARRAGCDLAAQGAQPGSTSQRNAERRGLRVVYTRAVLTRSPD